MSNAPTLQLPAIEALRRCVILVLEGSPHPQPLIDALEQRDIDVELVTDAPQAMAALASQGPHALIVHNPTHQQNLARLLAAVRRYHPSAICWQYDQQAGGLQPYGSRPPEAPPEVTPEITSEVLPALEEESPASAEMSGEVVEAEQGAQSPSDAEQDLEMPPAKPRKAPITAELSDDELAMLLGSPAFDDDDES